MANQQENKNKAIRTTYFSIVGNALLALIKLLGGIFGNSYALIADAIESAVDVASSIIVLMGLHYANRPADKRHPYGHDRLEHLTTFSIIGFLILTAEVISYHTIKHIFTTHPLPKL